MIGRLMGIAIDAYRAAADMRDTVQRTKALTREPEPADSQIRLSRDAVRYDPNAADVDAFIREWVAS